MTSAAASPSSGRRFADACGTADRTGRPGQSCDRRRTTRTSRSPRRCTVLPRPAASRSAEGVPFAPPGCRNCSRVVQQVPGGAVLVVADPDGEVVRDPTPGEEPRRSCRWRDARRDARTSAPAGCSVSCVRPRYSCAQERHAAVGIVLPAVLAVEDDRAPAPAVPALAATAWPIASSLPIRSRPPPVAGRCAGSGSRSGRSGAWSRKTICSDLPCSSTRHGRYSISGVAT